MLRQVAGRIKTGAKAATGLSYDALDLLRADHMKAEASLIELRLVQDRSKRKQLLKDVSKALAKHMALEENIFYPACERIKQLQRLIDHAHTDHQLVKAALKDLAIMDPTSRGFNTLLTTLIKETERHVMEEENKVFARVREYMNERDFRMLSREMLEAHASGLLGRGTLLKKGA